MKKAALAMKWYSENRPVNAERYFLLGKARMEARMFSPAVKSFATAVRLDPSMMIKVCHKIGEGFWNAGRTNRGVEYFSKHLELKPGDRDDFFDLAERCWKAGKYKKATEFYTRAIKMGREGAETYYSRGCVYRMLKKYKLAIADLDKVIEIDPSCAEAYHEKGICLTYLSEFEKAIVEFTLAIEADENCGEAYMWRATCCYGCKRFHEAVADYTIAQKLLSGEGYDSYISRQRGYSYVELGEWEKAIEDLDNAICLDAKEGRFVTADFKMRGLAYEKLGHKEKAEEDYKIARLMKETRDYCNPPHFDYEKKTLIFKKSD